MEMTTIEKLQLYIKSSLEASVLYRELAKYAPNEGYRNILMEFAINDKNLANEFQKIYTSLTGKSYIPTIETPNISGNYRDILKERSLAESKAAKNYGDEFLQARRNTDLKHVFYRAENDSAVQAIQLLYMLMP